MTENAPPGPHDALRSIGDRLRAGDLAGAEKLCVRALEVQAGSADLHYLSGLIALTRGELGAAIRGLRAAIALDDRQAMYHHLMGRALALAGDGLEAASSFARAVELEPARAESRLELALLHLSSGNPQAAREACRAIGNASSLDASSLAQLGNLLTALGEHAAALDMRSRLAAENSGSAQAHIDLAFSLFHTGNPARAVDVLETAVRLAPDSALAWFNYGVAAQAVNERERAEEAYGRAITLDPSHVDAMMSLGSLAYLAGDLARARSLYESALRVSPDDPKVLFNLGITLSELGEEEAADRALARSAGHGEGGLHRALYLLRLPATVPAQGLAQERRAFEERLDELGRCRLTLAEVASMGTPWFCLAYHGLNNRTILANLCGAFRLACPELAFTAAHCDGRRATGRLRVGFFSNHLHDHTVGLYFAAFVEALDANRFEVIVLSHNVPADQTALRIQRHAAEYVVLPRNFEAAREQIAGKRLDILIYPDIGMEPMSYFLAFARLAPIQVCLYGHPETTGIDTIDYFLSHAECESPEGPAHYSEKLLLLPEHCTYACFPRPGAGAIGKNRAQLGLPDDQLVLVCSQAPHKIHPDFDRMVDRILAAEPRAHLVLFGGARGRLMERVARRMTDRMGARARRVTVLPRQDYAHYLAVLGCSDVVLDTPHFNGGKTTFDAIAMRRPIVTLSGATLKNRQTAHLLNRLGLSRLASTAEEGYVETVLALAGSRRMCKEVSETIREADVRLFDDLESAKAFGRLVQQLGETVGV